MIQEKRRPYTDILMNYLELFGLACPIIFSLNAIYFEFIQVNELDTGDYLSMTVIFLSLIGYFIKWIGIYMAYSHRTKPSKFISKIYQNHPNFAKFFFEDDGYDRMKVKEGNEIILEVK
jgi:hypothetical protein